MLKYSQYSKSKIKTPKTVKVRYIDKLPVRQMLGAVNGYEPRAQITIIKTHEM